MSDDPPADASSKPPARAQKARNKASKKSARAKKRKHKAPRHKQPRGRRRKLRVRYFDGPVQLELPLQMPLFPHGT